MSPPSCPTGRDPPDPLETDSISMDTEHHEGRGGGGWERAAGSGGERLGGRGGARWARGRPQPRGGLGSPGLSASSAGLCLACTRDGEGMLGRSPAPQPRSGWGWIRPLPPAAAGGRDCPSAEPRRPRRGSRAPPEGLKRASASASAGAGWGLSFGKTTGNGGRRMRRPCWPCRTARSRPACRCC